MILLNPSGLPSIDDEDHMFVVQKPLGENKASCRVAEKCGYKFEKLVPAAYEKDGKKIDGKLYAIENTAYKSTGCSTVITSFSIKSLLDIRSMEVRLRMFSAFKSRRRPKGRSFILLNVRTRSSTLALRHKALLIACDMASRLPESMVTTATSGRITRKSSTF